MDIRTLIVAVNDATLALSRSGGTAAAERLSEASIVEVDSSQIPFPELGFACVGDNTIQIAQNALTSPIRLREAFIYAGSELSMNFVPHLVDEPIEKSYREWKTTNTKHLKVVISALSRLQQVLTQRRGLSPVEAEYLEVSIARAKASLDTVRSDLSAFDLRVSAQQSDRTRVRLLEARAFVDFPEEWQESSPMRRIHQMTRELLDRAIDQLTALRDHPDGIATLTIPPLAMVREM
ncbi:MAG: hypothetical protein IT290_04600 [Deltaproteobacteria bacterium]|nr:hypothetical protein [Deltaproteobacteria bacterium]